MTRIGYIASHIYRHTFEINEVCELRRQHPDARVYSFYRKGREFQKERVEELGDAIVAWNYRAVVRGLVYFLTRQPLALLRAAGLLAIGSFSNPVYWGKNTLAFLVALPILADAKRHGIRHLHANFGSSPATIAWLGQKILGTRLSITYHAFDIYSDHYSCRDPLKRRKLRDADLIVAVHEDGKQYLQKLVPNVDPNKFKVIRISVVFAPDNKSEPLPQPPLIVAAGNLVPKKGFDVAIRAVGYLKRRGLPVRLRILGEGPERHRLERIVREGAIRDRVELPGYFQHQKLASHLASAAVFVVPSRVTDEGQRDGIPTVVVEAWLSKTPVVASLVGGMREVIVNEVTGLVFVPNDAENLAEVLVRLFESPDLQKKLIDEGLRTAHEAFSSKKNVGCLLKEIEQITSVAS